MKPPLVANASEPWDTVVPTDAVSGVVPVSLPSTPGAGTDRGVANAVENASFTATGPVMAPQANVPMAIESTDQPAPATELSEAIRQRSCTFWPPAAAGRFTTVVR